MAVELERDLGRVISEVELKKKLLMLNPNLKFDFGGMQGFYHPSIDTRQSIYFEKPDGHPKFLAPMERGMIPEFNVWAVVRDETGTPKRSHVLKVGWGHTLAALKNKNVPGVTWDRVCQVFNIDVRSRPSDSDLPTEELTY